MENQLIKKLNSDKIKMNWNKNPIKMKLFLSFLLVPIIKSTNHLGINNGWTQYFNEEHNLIIKGGIVDVEYLENIQYGKNLSNSYNNFVNPFYLFGIINDEGKKFFIDYYQDDINLIISNQKDKISHLNEQVLKEEKILKDMIKELKIINQDGE
jgi:hypothetical protein